MNNCTQNPYYRVTQEQANRNNQTIQYFVFSKIILKAGGIIYGGYVRDIQQYLQKIDQSVFYNIFLDDDPTYFNDIDAIFTEKEFTNFIEMLSDNALYQINIYNNSNYSHESHEKSKTSKTSKTVEINAPFNRWKIDCTIIQNAKTTKLKRDKFLSLADFDVNSLYIKYSNIYLNPEIEVKTSISKRHINTINASNASVVRHVKRNINNKIARCINYDSTTFQRIYKMLSKGYQIIYKDHIIKKMPIKIIIDHGFYYCKHCRNSLKPIKNIGYGLESKLFNKMCFACFYSNYIEFIKSFTARSRIILQLLFVEVNKSIIRNNDEDNNEKSLFF